MVSKSGKNLLKVDNTLKSEICEVKKIKRPVWIGINISKNSNRSPLIKNLLSLSFENGL